MMCISVLAGCSLWERNDELYFEATVATITYKDGSVDKISKRELITAFNSYGYNYVQNYGMSMEEAVKQTVETIIEKYLTIKDVKDKYEANGEELFNDREKSYLWDMTFDAVYSNLKSYLEDYKADGSEESGDASSNASVFKDYQTKIDSLEKDADGNWVIRKKVNETKVKDTYTIHEDENGAYDFDLKKDGKYIYRDLMFNNIYEMTNEKGWKVAYNKYVADIKENYEYKKFKGDEWFKFEINRVYEILRDNYIAEKYEDLYNTANQGISSTTANQVLDAYSKRVRTDYTNYVSHGNMSAFESSILTGVADVDYIVENKDNSSVGNYFYVAPIKIKVDGLDKLKEQRDNGEISVEQYKIEVEKLFDKNKALVSVRNSETGEVENKISVNELYRMINSDLSKKAEQKTLCNNEIEKLEEQIRNATSDEQIELLQAEIAEYRNEIDMLGESMATLYRKYFYLYNDDDTNKGKDYNAVFGVDANGKAITPEGYDNDEIKAAIEMLYADGTAEIGDFSEVVQADDGFYIFFYAGKIENLFSVHDANFDASMNKDNILALAKTKINVFSSKTLLDVLFDELDSNNFSVFQTMGMNSLRNKTKSIVIHKENIKDLYK